MGLISLIEKSTAIGTYKRTSVGLSEVSCDQFIISMARVKTYKLTLGVFTHYLDQQMQ